MFLVGDETEQIAFKIVAFKAVIKPTAAFEGTFNGSVVVTGAVAAVRANDISGVGVIARLSGAEKFVRVSRDNPAFQIVALGAAESL